MMIFPFFVGIHDEHLILWYFKAMQSPNHRGACWCPMVSPVAYVAFATWCSARSLDQNLELGSGVIFQKYPTENSWEKDLCSLYLTRINYWLINSRYMLICQSYTFTHNLFLWVIYWETFLSEKKKSQDFLIPLLVWFTNPLILTNGKPDSSHPRVPRFLGHQHSTWDPALCDSVLATCTCQESLKFSTIHTIPLGKICK